MIAKLKGIVDTIGDGFAVIDVNGVGYLVFCSGKTLSAMSRVGDSITLFIETHVREDHIHLYGFARDVEKKWFLILTKIPGIGAKVAMAILSALSPEQIATAIASEDKAAFTRAEGVGAKLAVRIISELRGKADVALISPFATTIQNETKGSGETLSSSVSDDAISALVNLGYPRSEAYNAIAKIVAKSDKEITVSKLIKEALKEFAS